MNEREIRNEQAGISKIDISRIAGQIAREDPDLAAGGKALVLLDQEEGLFLKDAYWMADGKIIQRLTVETAWGPDRDSDEAAVYRDHMLVISWHEARLNTKTKRPNGIRLHEEDRNADCIFYNVGGKRLTVDGNWVEPRSWVSVVDISPDSPEYQKIMADFLNRTRSS